MAQKLGEKQNKSGDIKFRPTFTQSVIQVIVNGIILNFVIMISPSISKTGIFTGYVAVLLMAFINWAAQPLFRLLTRIFGIIGLLAISIFGNAVILTVVIWILPTINSTNFWGTFLASWLYAIMITIVNWIFVARSQEVFLADIIRQTTVKAENRSTEKGFVFMQLDGVSAPVLDWQIKAGNMPNVTQLLREEGYVFDTWRTQIPSTTPASQAGILLGSNDNIPAFRWYEKNTGEMVVANKFDGAALIEKRLSNGNGLLVDGGVSIGNLFSGDAPTNVMVMSKVGGDRESIKNVNDYVAFFTTPMGFMRAFVLSIGEMVKEVYQARRAISKNVQPRIHRGGSYILLRAVTNVLMRDMQTSMVIKNMQQGAKSIYVDFLDYDEIAHHAGLARPESLASLTGLDEVVGLFMRARAYSARPYEIILVSDHGQSQGPTFEQINGGVNLESLVLRLLGADTTHVIEATPVEEQSVARNLIAHESTQKGVTSKVAKSLGESLEKSEIKTEPKSDLSKKLAVVTGSGNLGNIWLTKYEGRATLEQLEHDSPELIEGLLATKGIGFIVVQTRALGPVCMNRQGSFELATGKVTGKNPIGTYPDGTQDDLLRLATMKPAPDIIVMSSYDRDRDQVYAFEGLVGNHGGLGGWQTEAVLLHPKGYKVAKHHVTHGRIRGAHTVHNILVDWLQQEGQHLDPKSR